MLATEFRRRIYSRADVVFDRSSGLLSFHDESGTLTHRSQRERAQSFAEDLGCEARGAGPVSGDGGLSEDVAQRLVAMFQAAPAPARPGKAAVHGRGDEEYWSDHGELTASLMTEIAHRARRNVDLYRRVGRLHDVDYLSFPHDGEGEGDRHPLPLVRAMRDAGVHPAICLAVLEHAPHAGFDERPSSRLSAALSAAEDIATLAALDSPQEAVDALSGQARELFRVAVAKRPIPPGGRLRVEADVDRFINRPLALALGDGNFDFEA